MSVAATALETYVACLTPPGSAAIATLALRGSRAWDVVRDLFRPRSGIPLSADLEPGGFVLGRLGPDLADEVVLTLVRRDPVPWVEVHCHGGQQVIRFLTETLRDRGVRECSWLELQRRTEADPLRVAAAAALSEARTLRVATILMDQYEGAFARAVADACAALDAQDGARAGRLLAELVRYLNLGRHLTTPWRVVVAGAPNVGKSSLVNALAGFARCVVSATPGATRDVVTTLMSVEGWPVELMDTAGLREGTAGLEEQGIDRARQALKEAELCLWVLDASAPPVWPPFPADDLHLVVNKTDLPVQWDLDQAADSVRVSARTNAGLTELCQALGRWLVSDPPPAGAAVPFTPDLCARVEEAYHQCAAGRLADARRALAADR
jgi:tRNA modification GTPase